MTVLDVPVRGRTSRAARRDAERAAGSLVRRVRNTRSVALGVCVLGCLVGLAGVVVDTSWLLIGWAAAILAAYVRLALADALRLGPAPRPGTSMHVLFEQNLHAHLARVADQVGVRCPSEVWVVVEPTVRLEPDPDGPVLYIGSPLLWHLDVDELDRLVAGPLSAMRAVLDPHVRPGLLLAARLDCTRLTADSTPVVGALVRRLGRRLESCRRALLDAVQDWGDGSVPHRLRPTAGDDAELRALREVEALEAERRRVAAAVGVGLDHPTIGAMATLEACERLEMLEPRTYRSVQQPAAGLLVDPIGTDDRLAERLCALIGAATPRVPRNELPTRVWTQWWRQSRDAGLPVVVHLTGRWPRSLTELLQALDPTGKHGSGESPPLDRVPVMGALLARRPDRLRAGPDDEHDEAGDQARTDAVVELVAAAVRVVLVEQGRALLGWDDVWGAQLLDSAGEVLPVDAFVGDAVARRDPRALLAWLGELGVAAEVCWDAAEPPPGGLDELPIAAFEALVARHVSGARRRQGRQSADVVVLDGWLLAYPQPERSLFRDLVARFGSSAAGTRELLALARTNRYDLVDVADPNMSVRLIDVTTAHLDGMSDGSGWRLRIDAPDRNLQLTGSGPAGVVAEVLYRDLGTRLTRTGTARPGVPQFSWPARIFRLAAALCAWSCLTGCLAVLAGVASVPRLPGATAAHEALAVLILGAVLVLLARMGQAAADRALRRRAEPPRLPGVRWRERQDGQRAAEPVGDRG